MYRRMHKRKSLYTLPFLLAVMSGASLANTVIDNPPAKVTWQDPSSYRDVKTATGSQSRYEQSVFAQLSKQFGDEAKRYLPEGHQLNITVTNLDLAGMVRYRPELSQEIRVLDSVTPPSISFSYEVKQGETVIKSGEEQLRDLNYQTSVVGLAREKSLAYEKAMITSWAKKSL